MKVVVKRTPGSIDTWCNDLYFQLIKMGWKWTYLCKAINGPIDKDAFIVLNYGGCFIDIPVNKESLINRLRTHPDFIKIIEENLIPKWLDRNEGLEIVEIPDYIKWYIENDLEYGGCEIIHEAHKIW